MLNLVGIGTRGIVDEKDDVGIPKLSWNTVSLSESKTRGYKKPTYMAIRSNFLEGYFFFFGFWVLSECLGGGGGVVFSDFDEPTLTCIFQVKHITGDLMWPRVCLCTYTWICGYMVLIFFFLPLYAYYPINENKPLFQVSVAPGGRWSRFKTYSTIQRTLEIWGFVISFIFKAWLNNQKFSYRG